MKRSALIVAGLALLLSACTPSYTDPKPSRPTKGSPQAQVLVEEFGDFQCPACGVAYPVVKKLQQKYDERVFWKYYHFPLVSIHPYAFNAALASECANDQGKFWEMHDALYENQKNLKTSDLYSYAENLGLDVENFKTCFKSRVKTGVVRSDMSLGEKRGVNATPSFYLNGILVDDWTTLETQLDELVPATSTPAS